MLGNNGSRSKTPGITSLPGTGLASWKTGAGIGAGLSKPGIHGTALRRRTVSYHTTSHPTAKDAGPCASGGKFADLIPRFLRLSALVAIELGSEARDKEEESISDDINMADADIAIVGNDESPASMTAKQKDARKRKCIFCLAVSCDRPHCIIRQQMMQLLPHLYRHHPLLCE